MLIAKIEDLSEDCVQISRSYLLNFSRNKPSKSITVGSGRLIVLNVSASPKMIIKIYCNFYPIYSKGFRAV